MARPCKTVNPKRVIALASMGLTHEEIAACENVNRTTLERRFAQEIQRGQQLRNASLRRRQFERAMGTNMKGDGEMLRFLGKQYLGQAEKPEENTGQMTVILGDVVNIAAIGDVDAARQVWLGRGTETEHQGDVGSGSSTQPSLGSRLLKPASSESER